MPQDSSPPRNIQHFLSFDEEHKISSFGREQIEEDKEDNIRSRGVPKRKRLINEESIVCMNQELLKNTKIDDFGVFVGDSLEFQM